MKVLQHTYPYFSSIKISQTIYFLIELKTFLNQFDDNV